MGTIARKIWIEPATFRAIRIAQSLATADEIVTGQHTTCGAHAINNLTQSIVSAIRQSMFIIIKTIDSTFEWRVQEEITIAEPLVDLEKYLDGVKGMVLAWGEQRLNVNKTLGEFGDIPGSFPTHVAVC